MVIFTFAWVSFCLEAIRTFPQFQKRTVLLTEPSKRSLSCPGESQDAIGQNQTTSMPVMKREWRVGGKNPSWMKGKKEMWHHNKTKMGFSNFRPSRFGVFASVVLLRLPVLCARRHGLVCAGPCWERHPSLTEVNPLRLRSSVFARVTSACWTPDPLVSDRDRPEA